jgi:uncharacterized phiE125 gp8 family phage protein
VILSCVTPASALPFSMDLLRLQCRIDEDDDRDDPVLTLYAWAAVRQGEFETNRVWLDSGWEMALEQFPGGTLVIPKTPCTEVTGITYTDSAGDRVQVSTDAYSFRPSPLVWDGGDSYAEIRPAQAWPAGTDVIVEFKAGWPADSFPQDMVQWMLVKVAGKFEQREDLASATRKIAIAFPRHFADSLLDPWYLPR